MHETHLRIANLSLHIWFLYDLVVSAISIVSCSAIQMKVWFQELPSVNSLFIFPQGYTRLKYWSTRQGRVVFLVYDDFARVPHIVAAPFAIIALAATIILSLPP